MPARQHVEADRKWNQVIGRYARAVRAGNLIETTATAAVDRETRVQAVGDVYEQTRRAIDSNLEALELLGASARDVIKTRIFLTDLSRWEEAGRAHKETFDDVLPASGFIGVAGFPDPEILVEIEMTAVVLEPDTGIAGAVSEGDSP